MAALYRIPLTVAPGDLARFDDLDLVLLVRHAGEKGPIDFTALAGRNAGNEGVAVQWLPSAAPSAIPGQRRGTLLVAPGERMLDLIIPVGGATPALALADSPGESKVRIKETPDALEVTVAGRPFVTYRYNTKDPETPRPYFHPLIGPTGKVITQMGEVPGKKEKHFHHTALWIAHQNWGEKGKPSCDNWQIGKPNSSRIEHVKFETVTGGKLACRFIERLNWRNVKGDKVLLAETRTVTIPDRPADGRVIDLEIVLTGQDVPVSLNRTPYHLLAARVLDAMLPANGGTITNSQGKKNPADGEPARWIDVSGKLDGAWQGVALFNHPANFLHPTPCLQFAGQTIGLSPTHRQPHVIEPGQSLRLRFRVLVHAGNAAEGQVAAEYEEFAKASATRIGAPERVPA